MLSFASSFYPHLLIDFNVSGLLRSYLVNPFLWNIWFGSKKGERGGRFKRVNIHTLRSSFSAQTLTLRLLAITFVWFWNPNPLSLWIPHYSFTIGILQLPFRFFGEPSHGIRTDKRNNNHDSPDKMTIHELTLCPSSENTSEYRWSHGPNAACKCKSQSVQCSESCWRWGDIVQC